MNPLSKDKGVFIIYMMQNIVMLHTTYLTISNLTFYFIFTNLVSWSNDSSVCKLTMLTWDGIIEYWKCCCHASYGVRWLLAAGCWAVPLLQIHSLFPSFPDFVSNILHYIRLSDNNKVWINRKLFRNRSDNNTSSFVCCVLSKKCIDMKWLKWLKIQFKHHY